MSATVEATAGSWSAPEPGATPKHWTWHLNVGQRWYGMLPNCVNSHCQVELPYVNMLRMLLYNDCSDVYIGGSLCLTCLGSVPKTGGDRNEPLMERGVSSSSGPRPHRWRKVPSMFGPWFCKIRAARISSPGRGPRQLEYLGRAFDDERFGVFTSDLNPIGLTHSSTTLIST